jgi:hypothetical protein
MFVNVQICRCVNVQMYKLYTQTNLFILFEFIRTSAYLHISTLIKKALSLKQDGFKIFLKTDY